MHTEKYETLFKEIKEDLNKSKSIPCSCIGRCNTVKIAIFSSLIYRFMAIPIRIPAAIAEVHQLILRFIGKCMGYLEQPKHVGKDKQRWRTHSAGFQNTLQGVSNQHSVVLAHRSHQWTVNGDPEVSPYIYSQLILTRVSKPFSREKNTLFNKWCWDN